MTVEEGLEAVERQRSSDQEVPSLWEGEKAPDEGVP